MWNLGLLGASVGGGVVSDVNLLESVELTSNATTVEFTNLDTKYAADYTHLQMMIVAGTNQSAGSAAYANIVAQINNDTGSNYTLHGMQTTGGTPTSSNGTSAIYALDVPGTGSSSGTYSAHILDILDPFNTSKYTTTQYFGGRKPNSSLKLGSGSWRNTASLSSIKFLVSQGSDFVSGSSWLLFGAK